MEKEIKRAESSSANLIELKFETKSANFRKNVGCLIMISSRNCSFKLISGSYFIERNPLKT